MSRLCLAILLAASLAGCLDTRSEKIQTRRPSPTEEELSVQPPEPYETRLRRDDEQRHQLELSRETKDEKIYLEEGRKDMRAALKGSKDPIESCEADRIRVLQSRNWADVGKSPPPEVFPKSDEPRVEEDPYAPVPKMQKKTEEPAAEGEKKDDAAPKADEPKAEEPKKD